MTWLLADYLSGEKYSARFFYYWNSTIHFMAFMINAVTIAKIKSELDRREALVGELESTRTALRAATGNLPACPGCGKPRKMADTLHETELAALAREVPELAEIMCEECRKEDKA